jgi:hypothetical protein
MKTAKDGSPAIVCHGTHLGASLHAIHKRQKYCITPTTRHSCTRDTASKLRHSCARGSRSSVLPRVLFLRLRALGTCCRLAGCSCESSPNNVARFVSCRPLRARGVGGTYGSGRDGFIAILAHLPHLTNAARAFLAIDDGVTVCGCSHVPISGTRGGPFPKKSLAIVVGATDAVPALRT